MPLLNLSVVIPAHNEEEGVRPTVERLYGALMEAGIPCEILVVNDHSTDATEQVLQDLARELPGVRYVNNSKPGGFGFAIQTGLERFRGDAVCIVMADASDDPRDVVTYYRKLEEGYECVFGSRFVSGSRVVDYPQHKLLINRLANAFINMLFRLHFNDTTNAFKAYRREVIDGVKPFLSSHFNITVELPLKAITRGYTYTTVPISWYNRATGVSKLKIKEMGSRYLFIVLYVWLEQLLSRGDYRRKQDRAEANAIAAETQRSVEAQALNETLPRFPARRSLGVGEHLGGDSANSAIAAGSAVAVATVEAPTAQRPSIPAAPPPLHADTAPQAGGARSPSARWLLPLLSLVMLIQVWIMFGATVHTNFVGDDWLFMQAISTTPLAPLLKPGAGYHYNPILLATIKEMYTFFGIQHVAAYHLLAYFLFWLSGVFVMLIARKLTGSTLAGALAGILFIGFGTQYEAAIWGVVAYGPAMSTVVYGAGLYCFMLAHDDWRSRGQRMLFYTGFMLALILGPFIYEQDITLVAACLLYRVFVVDQDIWQSLRRAPRAIISRIPAYLADFAIPALFFVGYLAFKVILGRTYSASSGISETPGLSAPWDALTSTATTGVFQAFFPGLSINELSIITLSNIGPRYHLIVLAAVLIVMLIALVKIKPIYKFLLLWAVMTICAQTLGLANISSRHLMLMTVPTAMLWAGALVSLPGVFARWGKRLRLDPSLAWQAGYGVSVLALVLFMAKGYRYSQATQTDWRAAIWHVDATLATLRQYATADPVAQNVYLVNLPDYTPAITGQTMYEFRNSPSAIVMLTMPGRFSSVTAVRTANDFPINFGYTTYETESQLETLARTPSDLVLVYDLSSGQLEPFQAPHPLVEYYNAHTHDHWVTTSTEPLASGYVRQKTLAYLSPVDEPETIPIFGCVTATGDHFLSIQNVCEGATTLSLEGWLYTSAQANAPTVPVYRCRASSDHFISTQTSCDGGVYETLLGYGGADK